jgi:hypothetical protein
MTNPATVTKSMGLPAYPQLSWFLQSHFERFIMTGQILPILHKCTFDTYSLTSKLLPPIGTMQKLIPALTLTATNPNHRAVMFKRACAFLDRFTLISSFYSPRQLSPKHNFSKKICFQFRQSYYP